MRRSLRGLARLAYEPYRCAVLGEGLVARRIAVQFLLSPLCERVAARRSALSTELSELPGAAQKLTDLEDLSGFDLAIGADQDLGSFLTSLQGAPLKHAVFVSRDVHAWPLLQKGDLGAEALRAAAPRATFVAPYLVPGAGYRPPLEERMLLTVSQFLPGVLREVSADDIGLAIRLSIETCPGAADLEILDRNGLNMVIGRTD